MKADQENIDLQAEIASKQPISIIVGDRLCVHCGYNLTGQSIFRESHYDLLIARCPECGSVTSLQDYPSLGRWANRWAGVAAGLWVFLLLAMWAGSSGAIFGISMATAMEASSGPFRSYIDDQFQEWKIEQETLAASNPSTANSATNNTAIQGITLPAGTPAQVQMFFRGGGLYTNFSKWWDLQNKAALIKQFGGWRQAVDNDAFYFWILLTLFAFAIGCFWGIALLRQRRRGLLIWASLIIATSCVFAIFAFVDWFTSDVRYPRMASHMVIAPPVFVISLAYAVIPLFTGILLGRPLARRLTKILLPPRLLSSLSTLWITDGLKPPTREAVKV